MYNGEIDPGDGQHGRIEYPICLDTNKGKYKYKIDRDHMWVWWEMQQFVAQKNILLDGVLYFYTILFRVNLHSTCS